MSTHEIRPLPAFADSLTKLYDSNEIGDVASASASDFEQRWCARSISGDILRSVAEDASVACDEKTAKEITKSITVVKSGRSIGVLVNALKKVATLPQLPFSLVEVRATTKHRAINFLARRAKPGLGGFLLSSKQVQSLPVIDDSLTNPGYARGIVDAFVDVLNEIRSEHGVTCLSFVEKNLGPVGALGMLSSLVEATGLPACVYRERSWSKAGEFIGYTPTDKDKTVIIYDLVLTGTGVRNPALAIHERFGAEAVAAIVLHSFSPELEQIKLNGDRVLRLHSLHKEDFGSRTSLRSIIQPRAQPRPAVGGRNALSSTRGENMKSSPSWRGTLSAYTANEKMALAMSVPMLNKAIGLIWNESAFAGMPMESPDGHVLFVPKEAVPLLRARGVRFEEQRIASNPSADRRKVNARKCLV